MATIWLNVFKFCGHRYQFTILPFYKFAITIASPYLFPMIINFPFLLTMVFWNFGTFRLLLVVRNCFYNIVAFLNRFVFPEPFTGRVLHSSYFHFTFSVRQDIATYGGNITANLVFFLFSEFLVMNFAMFLFYFFCTLLHSMLKYPHNLDCLFCHVGVGHMYLVHHIVVLVVHNVV